MLRKRGNLLYNSRSHIGKMALKNPDYEELKDFLFFILADILYENALKLDSRKKIGEEDSNLTGAFLVYHTTPLKRYYDVERLLNLFKRPTPLFNHDLQKLKKVIKNDGAVVIENGRITSSGVFFDGIVRTCKQERRATNFNKLAVRFLPKDYINFGNRIRVALAVALTGKENGSVFTISQTVFSNAGTGRLLEYNKDGTKRSFYLERNRGLKGVLTNYDYKKRRGKLVVKNKKLISQKELKKIHRKFAHFELKPKNNKFIDFLMNKFGGRE